MLLKYNLCVCAPAVILFGVIFIKINVFSMTANRLTFT